MAKSKEDMLLEIMQIVYDLGMKESYKTVKESYIFSKDTFWILGVMNGS